MSDTRAAPVVVETEARRVVAPAVSRRTARLVFATALTLLGLWIARDFLLALVWAIILVLTAWPLYRRFGRLMTQRAASLAPLAFTVLIGLALIVPLGFTTFAVGRQAMSAAAWIAAAQQHGIPPPDWLAQMPLVGGRLLAWWHANLSEPRAAAHLLDRLSLGALANWVGIFGAQLVQISIFVLVTLLGVFFLLREGERLGLRALTLADRLLGEMGERFVAHLVAAVRGTVTGTVLVALAEGGVIGVGYVLAGVPSSMLFAALTVLFAMLPLGAWVAFAAASLLLLAEGDAVAAAGLFGFGSLVTLLGDHVVQPLLIGGRARLPFLLTLIGIFGGVQTFGLVGLFLGPVIMAAVLMVWREPIEAG